MTSAAPRVTTTGRRCSCQLGCKLEHQMFGAGLRVPGPFVSSLSFEFEGSPFQWFSCKTWKLDLVCFSDHETITLSLPRRHSDYLSKHRQHHSNVACLYPPQHTHAIAITSYMHLGAQSQKPWHSHMAMASGQYARQDGQATQPGKCFNHLQPCPAGHPTNRNLCCAAVPNSEGVSPGYDAVTPLVP